MGSEWKVLIFQYFLCICANILVTKAAKTNVSCDFEKGDCNWTSLSGFLKWNVNAGNSFDPKIKDHTKSLESGKYARIQQYWDNGTGYLVSPKIITYVPTCFSFWYYIVGRRIQSFEVYQNLTLKSSIDIQKQNEWYQHVVSFNDFSQYYIILKATFEKCDSNNCPIGTGRFIIADDFLTTDGFITDCSIATITANGVQDNDAQSPNTTGIIVGIIFGIVFIAGLIILLLCFIRRFKSVRKKPACRKNNQMLTNDYTGHQSVALPTLPHATLNIDGYTEIRINNENYQHGNSQLKTLMNTSDRNYAKLDKLKNLSDNKAGHSSQANDVTKHDYNYFDETDAKSAQRSINGQSVDIVHEEIHKNNKYTVIDPNNDHSSGNDKYITRVTSHQSNYAILDPNETGFFRSKFNNETITEYEFAVPINDNDGVSDLQDPYCVNENGMYDSTGKVCHKEKDTNIYNHAVENVYDTSHERKPLENDGSYDHFFGDKTEDNYNITRRE